MLLTASTGKAAANINHLTLHSAFGLPVKDSNNKKLQYRKPGAEKLNTLRSNYTNLKLIIADEISMFGAKKLSNLPLALQDIFEEYSVPFADISILAVGDLLQPNPVGDRPIFKHISDGYDALAGSLWTQFFKLYELQKIVRQKMIHILPEFSQEFVLVISQMMMKNVYWTWKTQTPATLGQTPSIYSCTINR